MVQGYNAQAVVTRRSEVSNSSSRCSKRRAPPQLPRLSGQPPGGLTPANWRAENVNGSIGDDARVLFIAVAKHARRYKPRQDGSRSASKNVARQWHGTTVG